MTVRPVLGELDLAQVQRIVADDTDVYAAYAAAAVDADFLQRLAHSSARIRLQGVLTGAAARQGLADMRARFRDGEPVAFAADIATATKVDQVLVEQLVVRELAGHPERFVYAITLRAYTPPPPPRTETPPPAPPAPQPPAPPDPDQATLLVRVDAPGRPDLSPASVTVQAQPADGAERRTLVDRQANVWTETALPAATWTVTANAPSGLTAAGTATTTGGQTAQVNLALAAGPLAAEAFLVSFRFDKAFVEPCMRPVLAEVAKRAIGNPGEHLAIVGHTDRSGPDTYNQSLSERRAKAVYAYLTSGRDPGAARAAWRELRLPRPAGEITSEHDSWGLREAQQMLQDLGRYPGAIDGRDGPLTQDAVQATRRASGLAPGTLDDDAWDALIADYLAQDAFAVPETSFVKDCSGSVLHAMGCGETKPLPLPKPTRAGAFRPYRRVELLFTPAGSLPCTTPPCDFATWDQAQAGGARWLITPADPTTLTVQGSIKRLARNPDGTTKLTAQPGVPFVIVTVDGAFLKGEQSSGEPIPARTDAKGEFSFPNLRAGHYSLEVKLDPPVLVRLADEPDSAAKGPTVCAQLTRDKNRLDVVLLPDKPRRQVRLPVIAHLMTMLNDSTREPRTCPDPLNPATAVPQRTERTGDQVRDLLSAATAIWAPGRIAFDLATTVTEFVAHRDRPDCAVDTDEFGRILLGGDYPDVINFYLFAATEAEEGGVHVVAQDPAGGPVTGRAEGIAMGDRPMVRLFTNVPPVPITLTKQGEAVIAAHELGHYLALPHVTGTGSALAHRLMLDHQADDHTELSDREITTARGSANAVDCRPLRVTVTGAVPVGERSGLFAVAPGPAATVTLTAEIADALLAAGTLDWDGGSAGAGSKERLVPAVNPGITKVAATYTPNGGGQPVSTFARILVTAFALQVTGAARAGGPGGTTFLARPDPAALVTVAAVLDRTPEVLSSALVTWRGGDAPADPLRRTVSRARPARTEVSATVAGVTRSVTVIVFDLSLVLNRAPFATVVTDVLLEGVTNEDLRHVRLDLVRPPQNASLFRARAQVPGVAGATLPATLTSTAADGSTVETVNLVLNRSAPGSDEFLSIPILAIPAVIPRGDIAFGNPKTVELIRARSGGRLTLQVQGMFAAESAQATVHARVLYLNIQVFTGSGVDVADVTNNQVPKAQRAWAQAGIEVKLRAAPTEVAPPDQALLDLDHTDDKGQHLTNAEQQLVGRKAPSPAHSAVATDLNVYYLRSIGRPGGAAGGGTVKGIAYPNDPVIGVVRAATNTALGHEIGHQLRQSHNDAAGNPWPEDNIMHSEDTGDQRNVDPAQATGIATAEDAQVQLQRQGHAVRLQPYLVREP